MFEPKFFDSQEIEPSNLPAETDISAGWIKRIVYPEVVKTKGTFFGQAEVRPGHAAHRWHNHIRDEAPGYEVIYPENFEEIYYIVSGHGVVQWKDSEGSTKEKKVGPGEAIFFPAGIAEHQLFNNGHETIRMIFCGSPSPQVKMK